MTQTHSTHKPPEAFPRPMVMMVTGRSPQGVTVRLDAVCRTTDVESARDTAKL